MKTPHLLLLVLAVALVAALSSIAAQWLMRGPAETASRTVVGPSFADRLDLPPDELERARAVEKTFDAERDALLDDFDSAVGRLASLLDGSDSLTREIEEAAATIHRLHGQLQMLSIRRYFSLLEALPEARRPDLRRLATEPLSRPN